MSSEFRQISTINSIKPEIVRAFASRLMPSLLVVSIGCVCNGGAQMHSPQPDVSPGQSSSHDKAIDATLPTKSQSKVQPAPFAKITIDEPAFFKEHRGYFPDIGVSLTKGFAPFPVFFEGWESGPEDAVTAWSWDFGDGTESDPSGRHASGLNAAHVFETPGTYTVTLNVRNATGAHDTDSVTIEVLPRNGTTYYVDSSIGDDSVYNGRCKTPLKACGPWKTATKAFVQIRRSKQHDPVSRWPYQPGDQILFKRGQSFSLDTTIDLSHGWATQGLLFSAYGDPSEPKPIIQWTGGDGSHVFPQGVFGLANISFVDLTFRFLGDSGQSLGLLYSVDSSKQLLFLRVEAIDPFNGFLQFGQGDFRNRTSGVFLFDCFLSHSETFDKAITLIHGGPSRLGMINNTFDKSGNHIAYLSSVDKGVITGNVFSRPAFGRTALRICGGRGFTKMANNIQISNNYFLGWIDPLSAGKAHNGGGHRYNYSLVELAPNSPDEHMLHNINFVNNIVTNCESCLTLSNISQAIVSKNVFVSPSSYSNFINVGHPRHWDTRPVKNLKISDNVLVFNGQSPYEGSRYQSFFAIYPFKADKQSQAHHQNIHVARNIIVSSAKRTNDAVFFYEDTSADGLSAFQFSGNTYFRIKGDFQYIGRSESTGYNFDSWAKTVGDESSRVSRPRLVDQIVPIKHGPGQPSSLDEGLEEAKRYRRWLKNRVSGQP